MTRKRLGFFTRLLDHATPKERYRLATEQIRHAERLGFDSAWIAQHHFHEHEGGLPSPLVFLAHAAAHTERIRLGTAIITLPMENPLRVAEDAAVLDLLADGRLEVGFGSGGTPTSFLPFGLTVDQRSAVFAEHLHLIQSAWRGDSLSHPDNHLYPQAPQLAERIWIATFSIEGAVRAAQAGHGLMLSRTQPRPAGQSPRCRWTLSRIRLLTPISPRCRRASSQGSSPRGRPLSPIASSMHCRSLNPACASRLPSIAPQVMILLVTLSLIFCRSLTRTLATRSTSPLRWPAIASCGG